MKKSSLSLKSTFTRAFINSTGKKQQKTDHKTKRLSSIYILIRLILLVLLNIMIFILISNEKKYFFYETKDSRMELQFVTQFEA